jgi:flagellar hook protein FlgE
MNSTAYKASRVNFATLFPVTSTLGAGPSSRAGGANPSQQGLGATVAEITKDFTQGTLQTTGVDTDMAINGLGFFVVKNDKDKQCYTRDGSFTLNANRQLVTTTGEFVQGYAADANGNVTQGSLQNLTIPLGLQIPAKATHNVAMKGNLNVIGQGASATTDIYDAQGMAIPMKVTTSLQGTSTNGTTWQYTVNSPNATGNPVVQTGTITFDTNGKMVSSTASPFVISANGAQPTSVTLNFDAMTALSNSQVPDSTMVVQSQDGYQAGMMNGFKVGANGTINATFNNGQTKTIGQLAVATFDDQTGLLDDGGNLFEATAASGQAIIGTANTSTTGSIQQGFLEMSNVDTSREFVDMIIASRGFSDSSRIMSTSNQMLGDLLQAMK